VLIGSYYPGYDLIIDQDLKPWLLEVNASPSLSANTKEDYLMKCEMLNGMLDVVDMEGLLRGDEEHVSGQCFVTWDGYCTRWLSCVRAGHSVYTLLPYCYTLGLVLFIL
jgi:hypothetical protein